MSMRLSSLGHQTISFLQLINKWRYVLTKFSNTSLPRYLKRKFMWQLIIIVIYKIKFFEFWSPGMKRNLYYQTKFSKFRVFLWLHKQKVFSVWSHPQKIAKLLTLNFSLSVQTSEIKWRFWLADLKILHLSHHQQKEDAQLFFVTTPS